jgi:hypothetical protein
MNPSERERRRFPRLERQQGEVELSGRAGVRCTGIVDIGLGGIRLALADALEPGARVRLRLRLARDEEPLDVSGQVVWARRKPPFQAGIRFIDVDVARLERLL